MNIHKFIIDNNIKNYEQFEDSLRQQTDHLKGKLYEEFCKEYLTNVPMYKMNVLLYDEINQNKKELYDLPTNDKGIDLIDFDTSTGIQVKFRSDRNTIIPWGEMATFAGLTFKNMVLHRGLVFTNCYDVCSEMICPKISVISYNNIIEYGDFVINHIIDKKVIVNPVANFQLRDYQVDVIKQINDYFDVGNTKGKLLAGCGAGKTVISYHVCMNFDLSIYLVPSIGLVNQTARSWIELDNIKNIKREYCLLVSSSDIKSAHPYTFTTNDLELKDFMKKAGKKVIISTYHSANIIKMCKIINIDIIVYDEAHHTSSGMYAVLNKYISKRKLFQTATERIINGDKEISMDNEEVYGKNIAKISIRDLIDKKYLKDYQIAIHCVGDNLIRDEIEKNKKFKYVDDNLKFGNTIISASEMAIAVRIRNMITNNMIKYCLSYHNKCADAKKFHNVLKFVGVHSYYMDGKMSNKARNTIINDHKRTGGVMCSARVLGEGIDIPHIDCVIFVDNKSSQIDIIQCIGRALRLEGLPVATIILPLYIKDCQSIDDLELDNYPIIKVIRSLSYHDFMLMEEIKQSHVKNGKNLNGGRIKVNSVTVGESTLTIKDLEEKISTKMVSGLSNLRVDWEIMYMELKKHCMDNTLPTEKHETFGCWISTQRQKYKNNKLSEDQIKKLESVNGWFWQLDLEENWNIKYDELKSYCITNDLPTLSDKDFGGWIKKQRQNYKKDKLNEDQIKKLESIGGWFWQLDREENWNIKYTELKLYCLTNDFPTISNKDFGCWVSSQRTNYKKDKLSGDQIKKIESLKGWFWQLDHEENWNIKYTELKLYCLTNDFPTISNKDFGGWIGTQRQNYKNNKLSEDQIKKLKSINGWFWGFEELWNTNYEELKQYCLTNDFPTESNKGFGNWISKQRQNYKNNKLFEDQIKKLESIGGWFWQLDHEETWNIKYDELKSYCMTNDLPTRSNKDFGDWISNQRQNYKNNKLSEDQIQKIELVTGWKWNPRDNIWITIYNALKQYCIDNDFPVRSNEDFGRWICKQRTKYKKGKLSEDRIQKLELVTGWFWQLDLEENWNTKYDELKQHCLTNDFPISSDKIFGCWIQTQRQNYKNNKLSEDQIKKLESVRGMVWQLDHEENWNTKYDELKQHCLTNDFPTRSNKDFGGWIGTQRQKKKKNKLSEDQKTKLESIKNWKW